MISLKRCNALWDSVKTRAIVNNSWCLRLIVLLTFQLLGSSVTCVQDALHDVTWVQDALQSVQHPFQDLQGVQANIAGTDFGAQLTSPGPKADLASSASVGECISQEPALAPSRDAVTGTTGEWDKRQDIRAGADFGIWAKSQLGLSYHCGGKRMTGTALVPSKDMVSGSDGSSETS